MAEIDAFYQYFYTFRISNLVTPGTGKWKVQKSLKGKRPHFFSPTVRMSLFVILSLFLILWLGNGEVNEEKRIKDSDRRKGPSSIVHLSSENFNEFTSSSDSFLLFFYAPWCAHCSSFRDQLESTSDRMLKQHEIVRTGDIDISEETALAARFKIQSIPALYFYKKNHGLYLYSGVRSLESLTRFVLKGYEEQESLSMLESPFGPVGILKDWAFQIGSTIISVPYHISQRWDIPEPLAVVLSLVFVATIVVLILALVIIVKLGSRKEPRRME